MLQQPECQPQSTSEHSFRWTLKAQVLELVMHYHASLHNNTCCNDALNTGTIL